MGTWDRAPVGWQDFLDTWIPLGCKDYNAKLFLLAMVLWSLWTSRNKRAIEGKFPRLPIELMFKCDGFLQKWRGLMKDGEQSKIGEWRNLVVKWVESFQEDCKRRAEDDSFM